jgi:hypothetical protein
LKKTWIEVEERFCVRNFLALVCMYMRSPEKPFPHFMATILAFGRDCRPFPLKVTVSWDWDGLFVVWIERALFRDEPLIFCIPINCFLIFNFKFYFLQRYCTRVASLCAIGATLLQCAKGC